MDFSKRYYTPAERDAEIKAARETWNRCDPELTHLLGKSEQDFLDSVAASCPLAPPEISATRPLTALEKAEQDAELNRLSLFGGAYAPKEYSTIPGIAQMEKAQERQDLEKLVAPGVRAKNSLDGMIASAIEKAARETLTKGGNIPRRESEREPLVVRTSGATHFTKSGGRIEVDDDECTEYGADGGLLRSWTGTPSDRPQFESLAVR